MVPKARSTDPSTSHEAAASVKYLPLTQDRVLRIVAQEGPCTDQKIALAYDFEYADTYASPSGLRTRRKELVEQGLVEDSGARDRMRSGREAIQWRVTDRGLERLG